MGSLPWFGFIACANSFIDDFEVSIFLTEIGTRHSLLAKSKTFKDKDKIISNSSKLVGGDIEPVVIQEESDDESEPMPLDSIPTEQDDTSKFRRTRKHTRTGSSGQIIEEGLDDDKKKLAFKTTYEGFSIWGWVLCLLVERKGGPGKKTSGADAQALMAEWITSTQQQQDGDR